MWKETTGHAEWVIGENGEKINMSLVESFFIIASCGRFNVSVTMNSGLTYTIESFNSRKKAEKGRKRQKNTLKALNMIDNSLDIS